MPWGSRNSPWGGRRGSSMPWGGRGGRMPFTGRNSGPSKWLDSGDPKDMFEDMWDDGMNAPSEMGEMPGGWRAPTISVPNPVEVGDELERGSRDMFKDR